MPVTPREQVKPASSAPKKSFALISDEKLRQLYATMLHCRLLQERLLLQSKRSPRNNGHAPATLGHEAGAVGVAIDLLPTDIVAPSHGDAISGFLMGAPLSASFHRAGTNGSNGHSKNGHALMPLIPPASTPEAQLRIATGAAFAAKLRQNGSIAVAFCGEASATPSLWNETLAFAAAHRLPMIYVTHTAGEANLSQIALDCGLPGIPVDGSDVVAVYRVAFETIARVRQGNGPALIECRHDSHQPVQSDSNGTAAAHDPIRNMEHYLTGKGLFAEAWKQKLIHEFSRDLDAAAKAPANVPASKNRSRSTASPSLRRRRPLAPQAGSVTR